MVRRGLLLAGGLALAAGALYALLTFGGSEATRHDDIDDHSRAELESVLREAGD